MSPPTSPHARTSIRTAARIVCGFCKLYHYMRDVLHWLPVSQSIPFMISVWVWRCHLGSTPAYLSEFCCPISGFAARRNLRSASRGELALPFGRTSKMQLRAFSVVEPTIWNNGLSCDLPLITIIVWSEKARGSRVRAE